MDEIIEFPKDEGNIEVARSDADLIEVTDGILADTRTDISTASSLSMPIAQLSTLGAGVASRLPALRRVIQTTTVNTQGLYRL